MWESNPTSAAWKAAAQPLGQPRRSPHRNTRRSTQDLDTFGLGTCTGRLLPGCLSFPPLELFGDRRGPLSLAGASVRGEGAHIFPSGQEVQSVWPSRLQTTIHRREGGARRISPHNLLTPSAVIAQGVGPDCGLALRSDSGPDLSTLGSTASGVDLMFQSLACVDILAPGWVGAMAASSPVVQVLPGRRALRGSGGRGDIRRSLSRCRRRLAPTQ